MFITSSDGGPIQAKFGVSSFKLSSPNPQNLDGVQIAGSGSAQDLLAQAAADCGAHARALLYFETHVRNMNGGGYNPAAHRNAVYKDEEVTFLQVRPHAVGMQNKS